MTILPLWRAVSLRRVLSGLAVHGSGGAESRLSTARRIRQASRRHPTELEFGKFRPFARDNTETVVPNMAPSHRVGLPRPKIIHIAGERSMTTAAIRPAFMMRDREAVSRRPTLPRARPPLPQGRIPRRLARSVAFRERTSAVPPTETPSNRTAIYL
jgi:hypothetical protein